jgi:hypothetical protein
VSGVGSDDRGTDNIGKSDDVVVNWFATSIDMTRLYLRATAERSRALGVERSFEALVAVAARETRAHSVAGFGKWAPDPSKLRGNVRTMSKSRAERHSGVECPSF